MTSTFVDRPSGAEPTRTAPAFLPDVDILERPDELLVLADVPGARDDAIDVRFEAGTLTLHARVEPREPADGRWLAREYQVGDWHRAFEISEAIDAGRISAEHADGVLTLHLPKVRALQPRRVPVRGH
jgi:HSP20 family protein